MSELPVTPEGHILLLIKITENKTFKDYSSIYNCLESIVGMYEDYRSECENVGSGDLKDFQLWLDTFDELDCFQYSREINRYKKISRTDFKNLFDTNEENDKPTTNGTPNGITNGTGNGTVGSVFSTGAATNTRAWVPTSNPTTKAITNGVKTQADEDDDQLDYEDDDETWDG